MTAEDTGTTPNELGGLNLAHLNFMQAEFTRYEWAVRPFTPGG